MINIGILFFFMMAGARFPWEFLEMEELEYELSTRGISQSGEYRLGMVERLRPIVESRHRDLGVVAARDTEGEVINSEVFWKN